MDFKLNDTLYDLLLTIPEVKKYIGYKFKTDIVVKFTINKENVREVQLLINDEIVLSGLDYQDTVNDLGIRLYELYDEILYQKDNQ